MTAEAHSHEADELCEAGLRLCAQALRERRVSVREAGGAPCLIDFG